MVDDMLQQGVIQPSSNPFASPALLVKKEDLPRRFASTIGSWIRSLSRINFPCPLSKICCLSYMLPLYFRRLTRGKVISMFDWRKKIGASQLSLLTMNFSNSRWCCLGSLTPQRPSRTWWAEFFAPLYSFGFLRQHLDLQPQPGASVGAR